MISPDALTLLKLELKAVKKNAITVNDDIQFIYETQSTPLSEVNLAIITEYKNESLILGTRFRILETMIEMANDDV